MIIFLYMFKCLHFHWLFASSLHLTKVHEKGEYNICGAFCFYRMYLDRMLAIELCIFFLCMFHIHVVSSFYFYLFS